VGASTVSAAPGASANPGIEIEKVTDELVGMLRFDSVGGADFFKEMPEVVGDDTAGLAERTQPSKLELVKSA